MLLEYCVQATSKNQTTSIQQINMPNFNYKESYKIYELLTKDVVLCQPADLKKQLGELVLNISNTCNLKCKYCFADNGKYGELDSFMTFDVAKMSIDTILSRFNEINSIKFFGGEPLLNFPLIKEVVHFLQKKVSDGMLTYLPKLNVVTNLTILNEDILSFIKDNDISVTVSCDGPIDIHDFHRKYKNGLGSFEVVNDNIRKVTAVLSGYRLGIESVYTPIHVVNNFTMVDIYKYIQENYNTWNIVIHPLAENKWSAKCTDGYLDNDIVAYKTNLRSYAFEYGKYIIEKASDGINIGLVYSMIKNMIIKKSVDMYCGLGVSTVTVMPNGYFYPCYMLSGDSNFSMGCVLRDGNHLSGDFFDVRRKIIDLRKSSNIYCNSCHIHKTCSACQGAMYGKWGELNRPYSLLCDYYIGMSEGLLIGLDSISSNHKKWCNLLESIKEITFKQVKSIC